MAIIHIHKADDLAPKSRTYCGKALEDLPRQDAAVGFKNPLATREDCLKIKDKLINLRQRKNYKW